MAFIPSTLPPKTKPVRAPRRLRSARLPGFGPCLCVTLVALTLIVLLPLSTLIGGAATIGGRTAPYRVLEAGRETGEVRHLSAEEAEDYTVVQPGEALEDAELLAPTRRERLRSAIRRLLPELYATLASARVLASFRVTFGAAFAAALLDLLLGGIVACALVRLRLPFRRLIDALIDLPFAMPTAVCGIAMAGLYAPTGPVGALAARLGIKLAFNATGITLAMIFIGLPFVVRALQPAIEDLGHELEEAAESLGANRWQIWLRVLLPALSPALVSGFILAFARGLGEYGTLIFIAGNTPFETEVTSLLIVTKLESFDYAGATVLALAMLVASLVLILLVNRLFGRGRHARSA